MDALEVRNRQLARAAVEPAQRILVHRYRLAGLAEGFELLKQTSQRFNIKLHTLAGAVVRVAGPDAGAEQWFPRRARFVAPALPDLALRGARAESQAVVLRAALRRVLHVTETDMGNVQLAEHGMLRLEKHTGLNRYFTDFFAFVQDSTTSCAQAAQERQQITVKDVESADIFDDDSRHAILQAGSRAAHSLPLTSRGHVLGMISSHHEHPWQASARHSSPPWRRPAPPWADGCTGTAKPSSSTPWNTSTPPHAITADRFVPSHARGAGQNAACDDSLGKREQALVETETAPRKRGSLRKTGGSRQLFSRWTAVCPLDRAQCLGPADASPPTAAPRSSPACDPRRSRPQCGRQPVCASLLCALLEDLGRGTPRSRRI
ncbi:GAF domain-containing protein [Streptomyces luteogriseus]|uniref:GAF domain-containing protein n=1 Tax=Streptomyces luteogriseus TaxID=68233 RepID=UPI0038067470